MEKNLDKKQDKPIDLNSLLEGLPEDKREIIQTALYAISEERQFIGPLPAPEDFAKYEEKLPGAADRILTMAEKQSDHRISSENNIINHKIKTGTKGQILGFILVLCCLLISLILGLTGHDNLAKWIGVTTVFCVSIVFVLNKIPYFQDNDSE